VGLHRRQTFINEAHRDWGNGRGQLSGEIACRLRGRAGGAVHAHRQPDDDLDRLGLGHQASQSQEISRSPRDRGLRHGE
jgi:hypothetical protein